jgi:inward rectifier potassium channel
MAFLRKINTRAKPNLNTGFGNDASNYGGRVLNKDGMANIRKEGVGLLERISWYHSMLLPPRWKFFIVILLFYVGMNLSFAFIYFMLGMDSLGLPSSSASFNFGEAFFFSTQTFTTVGYGRISPVGFGASAVAAIEALIGLLSFALATGLLYAKFSKPVAYLRCSNNAVIAPYKDINALMLRVAPYKNNNLIEAVASVTLGMVVEEKGVPSNKFYQLDLELNSINSLTLSWTIVHPINEKSPLYDFTEKDFENITGEVLVLIKAF